MSSLLDQELDDSELNTESNANLPNYPFINDLDLDQDVVRKLTLNLDSIKRGNSQIYRTPLFKDFGPPESILKAWDLVFNVNKISMNDALLDLESSNRSKFSPRSIAKPWEDRRASFLEYFENRPKRFPADKLPYRNYGNLVESRLRPLSNEIAMKSVKNNTNSGLPYYKDKGLIKNKCLRDYPELIRSNYPCVLFTRTQENNKTRDIWGYPIADTLREMKYYIPLLQYQKDLFWRSALLGPKGVDRGITNLIKLSKSRGNSIISIDFSSFDKSVSLELQNEAFNYIKSLFQSKFRDDIDDIFERFATIQIITPDGITSGCHGIPSGSTFTNEVDSLVQLFAVMPTGLLSQDTFQIQGDDGVYSVPESDVDSLINSFEGYGLNVNKEKSYTSKDYCIYLQNLYHIDYEREGLIGGIYPTYRALNRLIFQERWADFEDFGLLGKDYYSLRAISIIENCKNHPLFEEFVKFIVKMDKYSLSYTEEGLIKYINYIKQTTGSQGLIINQYGDDIGGISNFETVKLIKKLAL